MDDVWSTDFAHNVIIQSSENFHAPPKSRIIVDGLGVVNLHLMPIRADAKLPPGPYFVHYGHLHKAYRLYADSADAFMVSTIPDDDDGYAIQPPES